MPSPYPWHYTLRWPIYYHWPSTKKHINFQKMPIKTFNQSEGNFYRILFCGDIMVMQGDIIPSLHADVSDLISRADILIGNCEAPVGHHKPKPEAHYRIRFYMPHDYLSGIMSQTNLPSSKWYLSMANNHTGDVDYQAACDTYDILTDMGITPLGRWQAQKLPLTTFSLGGWKFGIIAWTDWMNCEIFPHYDPVAVRRGHIQAINWKKVKQDLGLHYLIALPHWEYEFQHVPHKSSQVFAKNMLINQNVDILVGIHTHTLQPLELFEDKFCFYSIGNFCGLGIAWPVRMVPLIEMFVDSYSGKMLGYQLHIFAQVNSEKKVEIVPLELAPNRLKNKLIDRLQFLYEL